ncbi:hypothetical protein K504DRAFT_457730 [Pleomassaria siparia CBS 279.74]|uniref:Uncharacterized protein n=1 Tax=Pleomassaria siparia CBS 279.74 TaxID=1314801 RepID=A0A6G1KRQ6_9PLEO|nr:hypothetical protein K504DRAFT_457730 [Pleomassaria siparia CBS 279.74]
MKQASKRSSYSLVLCNPLISLSRLITRINVSYILIGSWDPPASFLTLLPEINTLTGFSASLDWRVWEAAVRNPDKAGRKISRYYHYIFAIYVICNQDTNVFAEKKFSTHKLPPLGDNWAGTPSPQFRSMIELLAPTCEWVGITVLQDAVKWDLHATSVVNKLEAHWIAMAAFYLG